MRFRSNGSKQKRFCLRRRSYRVRWGTWYIYINPVGRHVLPVVRTRYYKNVCNMLAPYRSSFVAYYVVVLMRRTDTTGRFRVRRPITSFSDATPFIFLFVFIRKHRKCGSLAAVSTAHAHTYYIICIRTYVGMWWRGERRKPDVTIYRVRETNEYLWLCPKPAHAVIYFFDAPIHRRRRVIIRTSCVRVCTSVRYTYINMWAKRERYGPRELFEMLKTTVVCHTVLYIYIYVYTRRGVGDLFGAAKSCSGRSYLYDRNKNNL